MNAKEDINYAFWPTRLVLWVFGIWPDPFLPPHTFYGLSIRFIITMFIQLFYVFIPLLSSTISSSNDLIEITELLIHTNISLLAMCKIIFTWYHGENLRSLMTSIMTDWIISRDNQHERNIMLKMAKRARLISVGIFISIIYGVLLHTYIHGPKLFQNDWVLIYKFEYFYNIRKSPNYEITFFIQFFGGICTVLLIFTIDLFIFKLLYHICAQLMNFRSSVTNLITELADKSITSSEFKKKLVTITMRHEHLIRNAKIIDNCYSIVNLLHLAIMTFQLCFLSLQVFVIITKGINVTYYKIFFFLSYTGALMVFLYLQCQSCQKLLEESSSVAYSVYEGRWYDISPKDAKNLMFMVYRSTIPLTITVGKFAILTIELFGTMLKTSVGYLSIILTLIDNKS